MGSLLYRNGAQRLSVPVTGAQAAAVEAFLLDLIRTGPPVRRCGHGACEVTFRPVRDGDLYCSVVCRRAAAAVRSRLVRAAQVAGNLPCPVEGCGYRLASARGRTVHVGRSHPDWTPPPPSPVAGGPFCCPVVGCGRSFPTVQALGGHSGAHSGAQRGKAKPRTPHPEPPTAPPSKPAPRLARFPTQTTTVVASMSFTCPDCPRVYDDSNRLQHHRRVIHDADGPVGGGMELGLSPGDVVARAAAGRLTTWKVG